MNPTVQDHFDAIEEAINGRPDQITDLMQLVLDSLPTHIQRDIKEFMKENPHVYLMSRRDLVCAWLNWNGIFGYEDQIIDLVLGVSRVTVET